MSNKPKLREEIASFLEKKVSQKTETDYVPGALNETPEYVSYESYLQIADAIIPMVKRAMNEKKCNQLAPYESASSSKDVVDAYIDSECYSDFISAINKRGYDIVTLPLIKAKEKL